MRITIQVIGFALLILNASSTLAQTIAEDLAGIRKAYYQPAGQISYQMKMLFYNRDDMSRAVDSTTGFYATASEKMFIDLEGIKTISDGKYILNVDENSKTIMVGTTPKQIYQNVVAQFFDSVASSNDVRMKVVNETKKLRTVCFVLSDLLADSIMISYDRHSFLLKEVSVFYNTPFGEDYQFIPNLVMKYSRHEVSQVLDASQFSVYKYVSIKEKSVSLKEGYRGYTLINNLSF